MPKPLDGRAGLGHAHPPLAVRGRRQRLPRRRATRTGCRRSGRGFIAGLLHHAREITAVTNQLVNSYKRLIVGYEAPVYVTLGPQQPLGARAGAGHQGGQGVVDPHRVPLARPGLQPVPRLLGDPRRRARRASRRATSCRPRPPANVFELTADERAAEGIEPLPQSLAEALDVMERSELVAEALGEHIFEWFLRNKRAEWADYKAQVTPFELDRYLPDLVSRAADGTAPRLSRPAAARAGPGPRPRRLPVEGRRRRAGVGPRSSPTTAGPARSSSPTTTPRRRSRCAGRCASATCPSSRCCCSSAAPSSATSSCATTSSTTSASTRSTPASSRPGSSTCSGAPGIGTAPELVEYGGLVLNLETYQAAIDGRPARPHLHGVRAAQVPAQHPGKVFTRETLLSRVWGYEYYGGARTVDVHIRRLRAKLGEEHANLIQTVRSVGYRFGQSRWGCRPRLGASTDAAPRTRSGPDRCPTQVGVRFR